MITRTIWYGPNRPLPEVIVDVARHERDDGWAVRQVIHFTRYDVHEIVVVFELPPEPLPGLRPSLPPPFSSPGPDLVDNEAGDFDD